MKKTILFAILIFLNFNLNSQCFQQQSAGGAHSELIKNDGTLWSVGRNNSGQLGNTTWVNSTTLNQIGISVNWASISSGNAHTVALKKDGTLWTWGRNLVGQLGDGTYIDRVTPVVVSGLNSGVKDISASVINAC